MISHTERETARTRPGIQADGAWDDADLRDRAYLEKTGGVTKMGLAASTDVCPAYARNMTVGRFDRICKSCRLKTLRSFVYTVVVVLFTTTYDCVRKVLSRQSLFALVIRLPERAHDGSVRLLP